MGDPLTGAVIFFIIALAGWGLGIKLVSRSHDGVRLLYLALAVFVVFWLGSAVVIVTVAARSLLIKYPVGVVMVNVGNLLGPFPVFIVAALCPGVASVLCIAAVYDGFIRNHIHWGRTVGVLLLCLIPIAGGYSLLAVLWVALWRNIIVSH